MGNGYRHLQAIKTITLFGEPVTETFANNLNINLSRCIICKDGLSYGSGAGWGAESVTDKGPRLALRWVGSSICCQPCGCQSLKFVAAS